MSSSIQSTEADALLKVLTFLLTETETAPAFRRGGAFVKARKRASRLDCSHRLTQVIDAVERLRPDQQSLMGLALRWHSQKLVDLVLGSSSLSLDLSRLLFFNTHSGRPPDPRFSHEPSPVLLRRLEKMRPASALTEHPRNALISLPAECRHTDNTEATRCFTPSALYRACVAKRDGVEVSEKPRMAEIRKALKGHGGGTGGSSTDNLLRFLQNPACTPLPSTHVETATPQKGSNTWPSSKKDSRGVKKKISKETTRISQRKMKTSTHSAALSSSSPKKEREKGSHCDAATQMAPSRSLGCRAAPFPSLRALSPSARSRSSSSLQGRHSPPVSKGPQPEEPHNINIGRCVCEWMQTTEDDVPDRTRTSDVRRAAAQHTRGITRPAWRLRQRSREADVELPFDWEISVGHLRSRLCARVNEKRRRQWDRWSEKATEAPGFPSSSSTPAPPPLPDGSALEICEEGRKALVNPWSSSSASGGLAIDLEEEGDAAPCEVSWGGFQKEKEIEREMERVELKYEQDSFLFPEGEEEEREAGGEEEKVQRELCAPKAEEAWVIGEVKEEKNKDSHIAVSAGGTESERNSEEIPADTERSPLCHTHSLSVSASKRRPLPKSPSPCINADHTIASSVKPAFDPISPPSVSHNLSQQGAPSKTQEGAAPAPRNNNASCLTKTQQNPPEGHSCIPKAALPKGNTCPQSTAPSSAVADALDRCLTAVSSFGFVPAHSAHSRPERRMSPQSLPTQSGGEERETLGGKEEGRGNAVPLQVPFMERQRLLFLSRQQAAQAREGRGPKELVEQGRKESPLLSSPQQVQPRQGSPLVVPQNDEPLKAQSPHAAIAQKLLHTVLSRTVASSSSL